MRVGMQKNIFVKRAYLLRYSLSKTLTPPIVYLRLTTVIVPGIT